MRRDLRELAVVSVELATDEVMPDFVLTRAGLSAIQTAAEHLRP